MTTQAPESKYLALDPGTTTGLCMFDANGEVTRVAQLSLDGLGEFFDDLAEPLEVIIVEEFKVFRHRTSAFANNKMEVSQAIGIIRDYARRRKIELVWQPPNIKGAAQRLTDHKVSGPHSNSHFQDAFLHGAFYLIKHKVRKSALEMAHEQRGKV